jgi:putative membrane protein
MRILTLTTAVALALGAAACTDNSTSDLSTDANLAEDMTANDVLGADQPGNDAAAMPTDAAGFAGAVAANDLFEIESARLAATKANSAEVKAFAAKLQAEHEQSSADLKAAAAKATPPVTVTAALEAEKQAMLDQLKAANGADFDRSFIDQQTTVHQQARALLENYVGAGDSQPLKDFAGKAKTAVQGHLDHLNGIRK